jgi:heme-degrading monooxygenase HmoA
MADMMTPNLPALYAASVRGSVELHMDLDVDPPHISEFINDFREVFSPVIRNQPGLRQVRLLASRRQLSGTAPSGLYRAVLSFASEEQWSAWVNSSDHMHRAWPSIERAIRPSGVTAVLYELLQG